MTPTATGTILEATTPTAPVLRAVAAANEPPAPAGLRGLLGHPRFVRAASRPLAPVVVWGVCAGAALALVALGLPGAPAVGVLGVLIALTLLRIGTGARLLTVAAMAPVALAASAPNVAWALAGIAVAAVAASGERPLVRRSQDLQRHLDWCRRREEPAHLVVVRLPAGHEHNERQLLEAFRLTDSVTITHHRGRHEIHAVVDDHRLSREGLERRIVQEAGAGARFGWAAFPEDGFTLEMLLERAAAELPAGSGHPAPGRGRLEPVSQPA